MMDQSRFTALAEAHGGDIAAWPEAEREAARAFAAAAPGVATTILSGQGGLDRMLAEAGALEPAPALFEQIVARAPRATMQAAPRWAGMAAAVMLSVGAGAGWFAAPLADDPLAATEYADAFGALDSPDTLDFIADGEGAR